MLLSIIIPAYNEETRIEATLTAVSNFLTSQPYAHEILVVDDGSTDATKEAVERHAAHPAIIHLPVNSGKGFAVRTGMLAAKGDYRLFMDADSSISIEHVSTLLAELNNGSDIVVSSRRVAGAVLRKPQPFIRENLGKLFGLLVELTVPLGIKDTQNGFKLFTAEAAQAIFSRQRIKRWAFDVEMLAIAKRLGYTIKEVPIVWANNTDSRVKLPGMLRSLWEIATIRLNLWLNRYQIPRTRSARE